MDEIKQVSALKGLSILYDENICLFKISSPHNELQKLISW